jgi:hypothetical protein
MRSAGRGVRAARAAAAAAVLALLAGCSASAGEVRQPLVGGGATESPNGRTVVPSVPVRMPRDLAVAQHASCSPDLSSGWLERENAKRGLRPTRTSDRPRARLYLDTVSAVCGQVVRAAVSAPAGSYRLSVVRIGWYGGLGGRRVKVSPVFRAAPQPDARFVDHGASPAWHPSQSLEVRRSWPPGYYLVQLTLGRRVLATAPLVVRAPQGGPRAGELFVVSSMTWTAYNWYGGRSLYLDPQAPPRDRVSRRARVVSVARPLAGPALVKIFEESRGAVQAVEHAGVDVDYATDMDVDATPSLVTDRSAVLTGSHTEYVTRRIYDAFEAARDAGTNLAFLGGNQFYWQARPVRDARGRPLTMTVYRHADRDPLARRQPELATVRWRDPPLLRPEARLLGAQYSHLGVVVPLAVQDPPAWLHWRPGALIPVGAASEVDSFRRGVSPPGTEVLAYGVAMDRGRPVDASVTYYVADSGAAVFDAGNVYLGCMVLHACDRLAVPPRTSAFWRETVVRVVQAFDAPRFGIGHPSVATASVPTYQQLFAHYGVLGVGTTVGGDD